MDWEQVVVSLFMYSDVITRRRKFSGRDDEEGPNGAMLLE